MAQIVADRVQETCTAPGTGAVSLLGAPSGYQAFSATIGNGNTTYYCIADQTGPNWEVGLGTYNTAGNTLSRTTVLSSSNAGALTNFSSGTQNVFVTYPAERSALFSGVIYENSPNLTANYTLTTGKNGVTVGPLTISTGITLTVPSGQRLVVL